MNANFNKISIFTGPLIKILLFNLSIILIFFLFIDYLFGHKLISRVSGYDEQAYRALSSVYSHTLRSNFKGIGLWGNETYSICTNNLGFKSKCNEVIDKKKQVFDIVFIGDSMAENIGLPYEDTFVGKINEKNPKLTLLNMAVSGYSPSNYYVKLKHYIDNGLKVKNVIVYMDVSDIFDETTKEIINDVVVNNFDSLKQFPGIKKYKVFVSNNLPLTYLLIHLVTRGYRNRITDDHWHFSKRQNDLTKLRNLKLSEGHPAWEWLNKENVAQFGTLGVDGAIKKSINVMNELYNYLSKKDITLSIAVYPIPFQIIYDKKNSKNVQIWKNFCKDKCKYFIDTHKHFFNLKKYHSDNFIINKFYIYNDTHFNKFGSGIIADDFMRYNFNN